MARWLYTLFFYFITPLVLLRLIYRGVKAPAYRKRIAERFGFFKAPGFQQCIWLHSVSVGETIAAAPIIKRLQQQHPHTPIVVTTMTPTGSERVHALFGDTVFHVYAPYDLPGSIQRFLQRLQPKILIIMETELWPNTIHYCYKNAIPVVLANARLSAKSAKGYRRLSALTYSMLLEMTTVVAQTAADADRFLALGMSPEQVQVSGSIKFDVSISDELKQQARQLKEQWSGDGQRLLFIAASTHDGEDTIVLSAFKKVLAKLPQMLLVLVPRHPERFESVARLAVQAGLSTQRRSSAEAISVDTQVVVGDTMGELMVLYGAADIAFVGGSFINSGGHNMLEPAAWGLPIITGDSDFNFLEISHLLQQQGALIKVHRADQLAESLIAIAESESLRKDMGSSGLKVMAENRGALDRLMSAVNHFC